MDFMNMFGKIKDLQGKMQEAQETLAGITASGEAGAGLVKVMVNGKKQVLKIEVENELLKPEDKEMMLDLIVAATNKAIEEVEIKAAEHIKKATEGLMPNIPGFDLGKLFGGK
jgi:nucleoid-associated protein EbfC